MNGELQGATALSLIVAACSPAADEAADTTEAVAATSAPTEAAATTTTPEEAATTTTPEEEVAGEVAAGESSLGTMLVTEEGLTLYFFDMDEDGVSACYDDCEDNWPVVVT